MLNINKTEDGGKLLYALEGRLDTITSPDLEKELMASIDGVSELVLDFAKLDYISSAGLRVLLAAYKATDGKAEMKVVNVNEIISDIFDTTGFSDILNIE